MCTAFLDHPNGSIIAATYGPDGPTRDYTYFVSMNRTKLNTRGGVEMTFIRERKSTHRLGTRLRSLEVTMYILSPARNGVDIN